MTALNTIQNRPQEISPFVVAWVDQSMGEAGAHKSIKDRFEKLSNFITKWLYFDCSDEFSSYVENHPNVKLICIMSGGMSRLLVPKYSHLYVIHMIYIFCVDIERAKQSMVNEKKVKGIFAIEDDVYERMADDLSKSLVEEGIGLAKIDQRTAARLRYEEAKRLLLTEARSVSEEEKQMRNEEIDVRLDQLLV